MQRGPMQPGVLSLYRRALRVARSCIPEQRSFALAYVRETFRDNSIEPGSHRFSERIR